jgi:hypothetical protein
MEVPDDVFGKMLPENEQKIDSITYDSFVLNVFIQKKEILWDGCENLFKIKS